MGRRHTAGLLMGSLLIILLCSFFLTNTHIKGSGLLKDRVIYNHDQVKILVEEGLIDSSELLLKFYQQRSYRPAWSGEQGVLPQAYQLVQALEQADREGLNPAVYHPERLRRLLAGSDDSSVLDLDLLLTHAFFTYGNDLLSGYLDRSTSFPPRVKLNLPRILQNALNKGQVREVLQSFLPLQSTYGRLRSVLSWYRTIEKSGGWPRIPFGTGLKKGDSGEMVKLLRSRLLVSGDISWQSAAKPGFFDTELEEGLKGFQVRHGLNPDGILGQKTLEALNVPVEERITQLKLSMERLRWLPQDPGRRYMLVNIPDFRLEVIEGDLPVLSMKVIVGREDRQTPIFAGEMTHLYINPWWKIPEKIVQDDLLPIIQEDPEYLAQKNIRVFEDWEEDAREIPAEEIAWKKIDTDHFPFQLRQEPGPTNSLGRLKFILPNQYNVYLHDTPNPQLFDDVYRAYSSGCIRLEAPLKLAIYLLQDKSGWSEETIKQCIQQGEEQKVILEDPVPVYLVYLTAWVDPAGAVNLRDDIYGKDWQLAGELSEERGQMRF